MGSVSGLPTSMHYLFVVLSCLAVAGFSKPAPGGYGNTAPKCRTVYETSYTTSTEQQCSTTYEQACSTSYEQQCSTSYQTSSSQQCSTTYVQQCSGGSGHGSGYRGKRSPGGYGSSGGIA